MVSVCRPSDALSQHLLSYLGFSYLGKGVSPHPSSLWTKLVEVMAFQLSYFESWKMMLSKCCTQYASKFGNSAVVQDWKRSVFIPIPKKGNAKECSNYSTIALISHASKLMLKILQARLQQYMNHELPDVQPGFRKGRGTRDQIANIRWIIKKQESSRKTSLSALLTMPKPLCGSQ